MKQLPSIASKASKPNIFFQCVIRLSTSVAMAPTDFCFQILALRHKPMSRLTKKLFIQICYEEKCSQGGW